MSEKAKISMEQKQKLKKYAVFALMAIICAGSVWLIFKPSDKDKAKEMAGIGFNADIPDPGKDEIIGDKKDAYEQEQMQKKQKDRMQSLQGYMDMLGGEAKDGQAGLSLTDEPEQDANLQQQKEKPEPIGSSVTAYRDINRTLGSFYEQPKSDPEKEEMKKRLEELEARMKEKDSKQSAVDEQLELMEKSYELAAKYMPQAQGQSVQSESSGEGLGKRIANGTVKNSNSSSNKTKITPVRQIQNQTVSALAQPIGGDEAYWIYDQPRNSGFNTIGGTTGVSEKNTISAIIHDDQTVIDGQSTRLRLTEPLVAGTTIIPENTIVTGTAKVQGEPLVCDKKYQ